MEDNVLTFVVSTPQLPFSKLRAKERCLLRTGIVEKLTASSKRAACSRSIYGSWGLRVQVPTPPLRNQLGESTHR